MEGVEGDHGPDQVQRGQERFEVAGLVRLGPDLGSGNGDRAGVVEGGEQVAAGLVEAGRALQRLAVDGDDPARTLRCGALGLGVETVGEVGADGAVERVAVEVFERAADRRP
jgi:hypothetical protein